MRLFTFLVLEILLSPITLTGYLVWSLWAVTVSQQQSLSLTALSPLFCRWIMHLQGIRPDPAAAALMKTLPSLNDATNWTVIGPTLWAMNLSGYTPSFFNVPTPGTENLGNMINTRTLFFDKALTQSLNTAEQIVILGAGFDTRLLKFCAHTNVTLFEVDQLATQRVKRQSLEQSLPTLEPTDRDLYERIHFVPVNFNQENWIEKLTAAGFIPGKRTFFLWEGVTYYLTEKIVVESIQAMDAVCGVGSAIAFDFFPQHFLQPQGFGQDFWWMPAAMNILDWIGEPFRFGPDTSLGNERAIAQLLTQTDFKISKLQMMGTSRHRQSKDFSKGFCGLALVTK